ncbi:MAG: dihydrofolate reductase family protein [Solirubrobacteraceae bacterium]
MRSVRVYDLMTLDGVIQAPHPNEEFEHAGWAVPYQDEVMLSNATQGMGGDGALLLGRRTYESMAAAWTIAPKENTFTAVMNNYKKYVASRTLSGPLQWQNSELLDGDARDAVAALKEQDGPDLVVLGSGKLIGSLMDASLIDELVLPIHPLVLGSGQRLFPDDAPPAKLQLVDAKPTTTGVLITTYRPA